MWVCRDRQDGYFTRVVSVGLIEKNFERYKGHERICHKDVQSKFFREIFQCKCTRVESSLCCGDSKVSGTS